MKFILALVATFLLGTQAMAYSYAAAGKEPLIDAREAVFLALSENDFAAVQVALDNAAEEITYLDENHDAGLADAVREAVASGDGDQVTQALHRAFTAEITRRLEAGAESLDDYQAAKVLVVKSKRFFDAIAGDFSGEARQAAELAISQCLEAIGNPGVFGVGQRPADPQAYAQALGAVLQAIAQ